MRLKVRKNALFGAGVCLLLVCAAGFLLFLVDRFQQKQTVQEPASAPIPEETLLYFDGKAYRPRRNVESILVIGVDKNADAIGTEQYINTQQSDFLLLLVWDKENSVCTALPFNRDTMTEVWQLDVQGNPSTSRVEQLCLAHTYGSGGDDSCKNTVRAVENLLFGQKIDHYAAFSMDAVPIAVDLLGGVEVTIDEDMTAIDPSLKEGETVLLQGDLALAYVRARRSVSDGSNQSRMARQETFLRAAYAAWKEKNEDDRLEIQSDVILQMSNYLRSDCTLQQLAALADQTENADVDFLAPPEGEAKIENGFAEFYVDDASLRETVLRLFYEAAE